jgi:hypothetical protein
MATPPGIDIREIPFKHVLDTPPQGVPKTAKNAVIHSSEEFAAFFDNKPPSLPTVDFETEELIAVSMGRKPTDGYKITIDSIRHSTGGVIRTYIEYTESTPQGPVNDVVTNPSDVVKLKKLSGMHEFVKKP